MMEHIDHGYRLTRPKFISLPEVADEADTDVAGTRQQYQKWDYLWCRHCE